MTGASSSGAEQRPPFISTAAYAAALGFAFLVLRIFAVAGYDWDTAFAVSTTLGLDDGLAIVFGSLMAGHLLTSILLICVLPLLLASFLWGPRQHRPVVILLAALGLVVLVALTVSFRSWWLPPVAAGIFGALALIRRFPGLRRASAAVFAHSGRVAGVALLLLAAVVFTPWVPEEHIRTADGTVTGYVLSVDSGYLNVLTADREFLVLISSDVRSRTPAD